MGLLWWHEFDGLGISVTSWTTPLQLSVFVSELNAYFTTSNQFAVEKTSHALYFPHSIFCFSWKYVTIWKLKMVANFRFNTNFNKLTSQTNWPLAVARPWTIRIKSCLICFIFWPRTGHIISNKTLEYTAYRCVLAINLINWQYQQLVFPWDKIVAFWKL